MDLQDSPEEAAFRAEARAFLDAHLPERLPDWGAHDEEEAQELVRLGKAWQATRYEHGWGSIIWPQQYGGRGLGPIHQIIWNQEAARVNLSESLFIQGIGLAGPTIIAHGREDQKSKYLEPILRGEEIWCQLFSEPGAGSDLAGLATRAERDGDDWVVTGQKTWCSSAHIARWGIMLARTDPSVPKHRGISYFILDMQAPGIEVRPLKQLDGGAHFNEVFLNEVRVPDSSRMGKVGQGWKVAMTTLMNERMAIGGLEQLFSFDDLIEHARGSAYVDDVARDAMGELYTWSKALELLNARVITKLGHGQIPDAESSMMKVAIARMLSRAGDIGLRLAGPRSMERVGPWQKQFLTAVSVHIGGGTDEIQKTLCAERVLGLPREPSKDRNVPFDQLPRS